MITVFGEGRGFRVVWLLEEMGLAYRLRPVDLLAGVEEDTAFLAVNPAGFIPAIQDGEAPIDDNSRPTQAVGVTVAGVTAVTSYVGEPTWAVGVVQINFVVPTTIAAGKQPVVVTVGGVASQAAYIDITE